MNRDQSTCTSTSGDTCSIRPRTRRLISYGDEDALQNGGASSSTAWSQQKPFSPFPSRDISPIPGTRLSQPSSSSTRNSASVNSSGLRARSNNIGQINVSSGFGLWESWSSLQGIASTLLGSDAQYASKARNDGGSINSFWSKASKSLGSGPGAPQWGPKTKTEQSFTIGSNEERQAMLQAKKRETLLLADPNGVSSLTTHKRRDSDLRLSNSAAAAEQDGDALVYVHKVKPEDTLAGVMIRYQCQPAVFRKVNRLWPNDNIQIREHVFLPVEACAVRGRKIDPTTMETNRINAAVDQPRQNSSNAFTLDADNVSPSHTLNTSSNLEPEYRHEYFVSIPGIPENVEIARIPRRTLGFFPPSRRKSQSFSDMDPYSDSPKTSLDLSSRLHPLSLNTSSSSSSRNRTHQLRPTHRSSSSSHFFIDRLKGPGGVGTLHGGPGGGIVAPGPAEDPLNKMFAHRLPNVAPPSLPRESFDSVHSASSTGLENVGGAIEGWVRKVGGKLVGSIGLEGSVAERGRGKMGDLIELEDSTDNSIANNSDGNPEGLGGQEGVSGIALLDGSAEGMNLGDQVLVGGKGNVGAGGASISATEEALLRERFPPRGRMVEAQTLHRRR